MTSNHNYECFNGGCHGMAANSEIYASLNVKSNIRNETHKENMQRKGQRIRKWLW